MFPFAEEFEYQIALNEIQDDGIDKKQWLMDNFFLYKTTVSWPPGIPPIPWYYLEKTPLILAFHKKYEKIFWEFDVKLDYTTRTIISIRERP